MQGATIFRTQSWVQPPLTPRESLFISLLNIGLLQFMGKHSYLLTFGKKGYIMSCTPHNPPGNPYIIMACACDCVDCGPLFSRQQFNVINNEEYVVLPMTSDTHSVLYTMHLVICEKTEIKWIFMNSMGNLLRPGRGGGAVTN